MPNFDEEIVRRTFPKALNRLQFYVNKDFYDLDKINPKMTLLSFLRENNYTGTKFVCGEGGCGACCVVVAEFNPVLNKIRYRTANSCLMPLCSASGKQIITVEGLGNPECPHPIQERLAVGNGSQCGFCTPGFVMSLYGLLKIKPDPTIHDIEEAFDGNLCRCTGYRSILESSRTFVKSDKNVCAEGEHCKGGNCGPKLNIDFDKLKDYDPLTQDPPFPDDLTKINPDQLAVFENESCVWIKPSCLGELLKAKEIWPTAKLIGGNSEVGVEMAARPLNQPNVFVYVGDLVDLRDVSINDDQLEIGINITLTDLINSLQNIKKAPPKECHKSLLTALLSNLRWFASRHIRNFATLAGNIATGSPISDLNPIFMANDAKLTVGSLKNGQRTIDMREFFLGYRKVNLQPDEILMKVTIPLPQSKFELIQAFKQSKRKSDDIAIVNGCFRVKINDQDHKIERLDASFGGVSPKTIYLSKLKKTTEGLVWGDEQTFRTIQNALLDEVKIEYSAPGAHPTYRRTLVVSFFTRFWYQTLKELKLTTNIDARLLQNVEEIERGISTSTQDVYSKDHEPYLGTTSPHVAALLHATGSATYIDDIPKQHDELYAWPVMSTKAHANIIHVDESKALQLKGVHAFVSHKDLPGHRNIWGIGKDEEYFASKEVLFHGQLIGLIIADDRSLAKLAANLVEVKYEELSAIITIDDAIKADSFFNYDRRLCRGTIDENTFKIDSTSDDVLIEGKFEIGGQEHFYLESLCCLVIPKRDLNEIQIFSSNQNNNEIQLCASHALDIPSNRIEANCKRIGGGFGGKETRTALLAIPCAVAANKLKKPVRCVLDRDADMIMSGKRHPFKALYKLRVSKDGIFKAYDLTLISNGGHSLDLSAGVMDRAVYHSDNVYNFLNIRVAGKIAKTNIASNTAFRGFGLPQSFAVVENVITQVAEKLGINQTEIRMKNMYKENDNSLISMKMNDFYVPEMFQSLANEFQVDKKRAEIEQFNKENVWKKRGMALIPMVYHMGFGLKFLNQGAALVNIYTDGSILVATPGVEMGQGINTKLIQIAANALQVPDNTIHINMTSTVTVPNGVPTAASFTTDLQGAAVSNACNILVERIKPYREKNPNGSMADWASAAFLDRVSLSATGFFKYENDISTNTVCPYFYYTAGVSASLVELDLLTGDHTILRSDVYMDIGKSINYSVDVGQVEGAFVQGIGLFTIEDVLHLSANHALATKGPGAYKIPTAEDIPQEFNVKFLKDKEYVHLKNPKKSKAVGEPPLLLGFSVFLALRDAVNYARKANGLAGVPFTFNSPATSESLRLACGDSTVESSQVLSGQYSDEKLFFIRP